VAAAERQGRRLYAVLLGSDGDRAHFADARKLFDYGFEQLGLFGDASTGAPYASTQGRREGDPVVTMAAVDTYLHLAGQGLMLESPAPLRALPEPEPPPIVEVTRNPDPGPRTVMDTMRFWLDLALGA
jgi:D-alanyl-D-alanine carboxypeptidase